MKSLYPDILFHFTSKAGLYGILENTFSVSYAREKVIGNRKSVQFAVPMVSFCDLRLSQLKDHMGKYKNYGIGLTKEWANRNGLNPVFYANKSSPFIGDFIKGVEGIYQSINSFENTEYLNKAHNNYMNVTNAYRYMKNYEGDLTRQNGKTTRNYRFADEREWRYVPPLIDTDDPFIPIEKIDTEQKKTLHNQNISHLKLRFEPEDIQYLIIENDNEINELIDHLDKVKGKYSEPTRRRLASRILTAKQIENDM